MFRSQLPSAVLGVIALSAAAIGPQGCAAARASRNGVFNENQYLRKDFIVRPADGTTDPGWYMKATIVQTSSPNPLAPLELFTGAENNGALVRFVVTQDKLQLVDMRELSNTTDTASQNTRTPAVVNAWPITNVDLKYRINLDGENTNFYEENQENDWQIRQWVKLNFDKNDYSDVAGLGPFQQMFLAKCTTGETSASLVQGSFKVDEAHNYMQWTTSVSATLNLNDKDCQQAFGTAGQDAMRINRSTVSFNVMYSMVRANPVDPASYQPLAVDEKDHIRYKYGPIEITNYSRDTATGLLAARQLTVRYNPSKPIVWFFAKGYPQDKMDMWRRPGGIVEQTNDVLKAAGATARISILNYNDATAFGDGKGPERQYGDIRYNFIRWESDLDTSSPFLAVTQFQPDLRTGELISASINVADAPLKDYVVQRVAAYLQKVIGADPFTDPPPDPSDLTKQLPKSCAIGDTVPLLPSSVQKNIYGQSSLYQRMAQYLPTPKSGASPAGPRDYVYQHTGDDGAAFYKAYYSLIPYTTYADPAMNQFVTPNDLSAPTGLNALMSTLHGEAQFQEAMSQLDHGKGLASTTFSGGKAGMQEAYNAADSLRQLWQAHRDYTNTWLMPHSLMRGDTPDLISFPYLMSRSTRRCVESANGAPAHWQTKDEWQTQLLQTYYENVVWHEFGHVMGLEHNFMGSVDKPNWPTYTAKDGSTQYGKLSSSIMEYSVAYDDVVWNSGAPAGKTPTTGWLPYDRAAIAWIYGNATSAANAGSGSGVVAVPGTATKAGISGQTSATSPWNDPLGFDGATEKQFLFCSHQHLKYTPLCRMFDVGSTPSEITAADIEQYEWNYQWRNFRNYYKVWDDSQYATKVANIVGDTRRFLALSAFDWNPAKVTDRLIRIGVTPPPGATNSGLYYTQLANHFTADVGSAQQLIAAFHEAVIQQGSGQRPFQTVYDPYFGDVTQQGIAIDKELALVNWLGLWPFDNYDPSQAAGYLGSALVLGPLPSGSGTIQPSQAWSTAASMLGEKGPWDAYPSFFPTAVALFAHDTQSPTFTGMQYPQIREWIGGHVFTRLPDVLSYFQNIAVQNPFGANGCKDAATCTYNPMLPQSSKSDIGHSNPTSQAFVGPDGRRWTWTYMQDRNIWYFVDQDRNPSSYQQVFTYNQDLNTNYDDGNNTAAGAQSQIFGYQARIKYMVDAYGLFSGDTGAQ